MNSRSKAILLFVLVGAFSVLIFGGARIDAMKPPIPARVLDASGRPLFTGDDVMAGQRFYLARGGQHIGSIWGHGAYLAADWSADALHRTGLVAGGPGRTGGPGGGARASPRPTSTRSRPGEKGRVQALVAQELRQNRYDAATDTLTLSRGQAAAIPALVAYYTELFGARLGRDVDPGRHRRRPAEDGRNLTAFFFWTAWAAGTNRPGETYTYTANWPYDPLVGERPAPVGAGLVDRLGGAAHPRHRRSRSSLYMRNREETTRRREFVPLAEPNPTPSQRATLPYFLVALLLFVLQVVLGLAHRPLRRGGQQALRHRPRGDPALRRDAAPGTCSWRSSGSPPAGSPPASSSGRRSAGRSPRARRRSCSRCSARSWSSSSARSAAPGPASRASFGNDGYLFGHQGYEYIELGRVWQVALIVGHAPLARCWSTAPSARR